MELPAKLTSIATPQPLELDKAVPETILKRILHRTSNKQLYPKGTTLRHVLGKLATFPETGDIDEFYDANWFIDEPAEFVIHERDARKLLGKGATRLIDIFLKSRPMSPHFKNASPLQLFEYDRLIGRKAIPAAIPKLLAELQIDRADAKLMYNMFSNNVLDASFWRKKAKAQLAIMATFKKAPFSNPKNWRMILRDVFGVDMKALALPQHVGRWSYSEPEMLRMWRSLRSNFDRFFDAGGISKHDRNLDQSLRTIVKHLIDESPSPAREAARRGGGMGPPRPKPSPSPSLSPDCDPFFFLVSVLCLKTQPQKT